MSDDFLKKIKNNQDKQNNNPLDKLFQKKKENIVPEQKATPKEEEEGFDGIENLGTTGTPRADFDFLDDKKEEEKEKEEEKDIIDKIPENDLEKANILEKKEEVDALNISTNSSFKDIVLDDSEEKKKGFDEERINKIVSLLRENKPSEAIKLIEDIKNEK